MAVGRSGPNPTKDKRLRCGDGGTDRHSLINGHMDTLTDIRMFTDTFVLYTLVTVKPGNFMGTFFFTTSHLDGFGNKHWLMENDRCDIHFCSC